MKNILKKFARDLRKEPTEAERRLWRRLRMKQMDGVKFRRQHPIGKYIVDFICLEKRLIVEIDGGQHGKERGREDDKIRDEWFSLRGYKVLRFWNNEVMKNTEGVLETIYKACMER
ncbi:MAG: endonuclease domain-containing protein [Candidatus Nitrospinota bacterium M3_3B_026]